MRFLIFNQQNHVEKDQIKKKHFPKKVGKKIKTRSILIDMNPKTIRGKKHSLYKGEKCKKEKIIIHWPILKVPLAGNLEGAIRHWPRNQKMNIKR